MSRHGKSKTGRPQGNKPRKIAEPKPQKTIVAAEATGAPKREEVVRQAPAPVAPPSPKPPVAAAKPVAAKPAPAPVLEPAPEREQRALDSAVETIERSLHAASRGTVAVNRKLIDIGWENVASGLDLAKSLAGAKSPIEAARLQLAFWEERMRALLDQATELRALSSELVATANEPLREHMRRGLAPRI